MKTFTFTCIIVLLFSIATYAQEAPIQQNELPAEARSFLKEHFKNPFHHAMKEVNGNRLTYEVILDDDTEIEFDDAGRWVEVEGKNKGIPTSFIQKPINDYLKINYPKVRISSIERTESRYHVELTNGIDLRFDAQGSFMKME